MARVEERFRLLVESVQDYAIFMLDPQGYVLTWNKGAARLKGYKVDEILGRSFEVFYPQAVVATGWPQEELRLATERGRFEDEGWRVRKDGSRFWANVVITPLRGPDGTLQGFAKVTRDLSERRHHEELLRRSEEQFRMLLASVKDYAIFM
ncbi:MAG TPA: PAS domain S-box protein, partial [Burkholderiaceae bacterium]|nr:PAS domain S-box protein [Burkholderiaceae bacterium]